MLCFVVSTKPLQNNFIATNFEFSAHTYAPRADYLLASGISKCLSEKRPANCVTIIPLNSASTSQS